MKIFCRLKKDRSLKLDDSQKVWLVEKGNLALFIEKINLDRDRRRCALGDRNHLFTVGAGEATFGVKKLNFDSLTLVAIASETTELREISLNNLATQQETEEAIALYQRWLDKLHQTIIPDAIEIDTILPTDFISTLNSQKFQATVQQKIQQREQLDNRVINKSLLELISAIETSSEIVSFRSGTPLLVAAGAVARATGVSLTPSTQSLDSDRIENPIQVLARASQFKIRRVLLKTNWWQQEHSALLGYIAEDKLPVALLPSKKGYVLFNPQTRSRTPIDRMLLP